MGTRDGTYPSIDLPAPGSGLTIQYSPEMAARMRRSAAEARQRMGESGHSHKHDDFSEWAADTVPDDDFGGPELPWAEANAQQAAPLLPHPSFDVPSKPRPKRWRPRRPPGPRRRAGKCHYVISADVMPASAIWEKSAQVPNWIIASGKFAQLTGNAAKVLVALCHRADKRTGRCYPSQRRIGEDSGVHPKEVWRFLADLEALKVISKVGSHPTGHGGRSTVIWEVDYRGPLLPGVTG